ncbi:MAG: FtsL-like putative cell division protein [Crocinitomicaceae bacterium]
MSSNEYIDQETADLKKAETEAKEAKKKSRRSNKAAAKTREGGRLMVQIMNGEFLTKDWFIKNLPFTFYVAFLLVVLISWGYYAESMTRKEVELQEELSELNSEYFTLSSEYITKRGRQQIKDDLAGTGLVESRVSPKKIRVRKYVFN